MWDDERCSAEDVGGNLGGPCVCSRCIKETTGRTPDPGPTLAEVVRGRRDSDGIDRSRYVYEGPNGTPRPTRDYSPNTRLHTPIANLVPDRSVKPLIPRDLPAGSCPCSRCRVDLAKVAAEGKLGHLCVTIETEPEVTIPALDVRRAKLENAARDFAETCPSLYQTISRQLKPDPRTVERYTAQLHRAALKYAAEYLAEEAKRDGGDYNEAIAELRDPTIRDVP